MKNIQEIDKNFKPESIEVENLKLFNSEAEPFKIYGVQKFDNSTDFLRIPEDIAKKVSDGVKNLNTNTAGGRIRFKTDSEYVFLKCTWPYFNLMPHMPATGSSGFDLYADGDYVKTFTPTITYRDGYIPVFDIPQGYESIIHFGNKKMRDIIINFPLYNPVSTCHIGLEEDAQLLPGNEYLHKKPVVFYGSSITQGGCASRPGNSYQQILSRRLDFDYINLGFSGNARAEDEIADYIASLDMSVFVYDYDHNAPTKDFLAKTHYPMYEKIRKANPTLPIILLSSPNTTIPDGVEARRDIIYNTYQTAKNNGDENIYFIDGIKDIFMRHDFNIMTVDSCHPNDFGFSCMAEAIEEILKNVL